MQRHTVHCSSYNSSIADQLSPHAAHVVKAGVLLREHNSNSNRTEAQLSLNNEQSMLDRAPYYSTKSFTKNYLITKTLGAWYNKTARRNRYSMLHVDLP